MGTMRQHRFRIWSQCTLQKITYFSSPSTRSLPPSVPIAPQTQGSFPEVTRYYLKSTEKFVESNDSHPTWSLVIQDSSKEMLTDIELLEGEEDDFVRGVEQEEHLLLLTLDHLEVGRRLGQLTAKQFTSAKSSKKYTTGIDKKNSVAGNRTPALWVRATNPNH